MRISDWSSDVCSSDLKAPRGVIEVGCWAHARRKFTDILEKNPSQVAAEAVVRISELFAIERDIKGAPPDERRRVRQQLALPKMAALRPWLQAQMQELSWDSALAKACRYPLNRWAALRSDKRLVGKEGDRTFRTW